MFTLKFKKRGCTLRPGLNKGKVRGGMNEKTEEAEFWEEEPERQLETKEKEEREAGRN